MRKDDTMITIRMALEKDIDRMLALLSQVLEVHAAIRPDIFVPGTTKYTGENLREMILDEKNLFFAAVNEEDELVGYAMCQLKEQPFSTTMIPFTSIYIDDLCVDEAERGKKIGQKLFEAVLEEGRRRGCYEVTLNVWEGNDSARRFYDRLGMKVKETNLEYIL